MALSATLAGNGHTPESVRTTAKVHLRNLDGQQTLARIDLDTTADVPGLDDAQFQEFARQAKEGCPVSRALAAIPEIELTARLASS